VRVIAGSARGHSLKAPKGLHTRPTLDRVREAIFNVLAVHIPGAEVLDLFAGSGAMGIEALSRGAANCVFNDSSRQAVQVIKENLRHTKLEDKAMVYNLDAGKLLAFLQDKNTFDLVFLDPPYQAGLYEDILQLLSRRKLLKKDAIVVVESGTDLVLDVSGENLQLVKQSRYGDTLISYYKSVEE